MLFEEIGFSFQRLEIPMFFFGLKLDKYKMTGTSLQSNVSCWFLTFNKRKQLYSQPNFSPPAKAKEINTKFPFLNRHLFFT